MTSAFSLVQFSSSKNDSKSLQQLKSSIREKQLAGTSAHAHKNSGGASTITTQRCDYRLITLIAYGVNYGSSYVLHRLL